VDTYLLRSDDPDCGFDGEENDPYCRNGVYEEGEDFNDCGNDGDCSIVDEDGSQDNGEKDAQEEYADGGIYIEGCKHYSDRAEYKVYRVGYDQDAMGEVEGQYYIDQDEWVRRDSIYSNPLILIYIILPFNFTHSILIVTNSVNFVFRPVRVMLATLNVNTAISIFFLSIFLSVILATIFINNAAITIVPAIIKIFPFFVDSISTIWVVFFTIKATIRVIAP
jgi:hypothetical protein